MALDLHPELLVDVVPGPAGSSAIDVQVEHGVERVHALERGHSLQEVAVWRCSKDLRIAHLLAAQGLVVKSRLGWCSGHLSGQDQLIKRAGVR